MHKFTDSKGTKWNVVINIGTAKRLRADNFDILNEEKMRLYLTDAIDRFNLLYLICEPQAKELGISEEEFGERVGAMDSKGNYVGDTSSEALIGELQNFYPVIGHKALALVVKKTWAAMMQIENRSQELLSGEKLDTTLQHMISTTMMEVDKNLDSLGPSKTSTKPQE